MLQTVDHLKFNQVQINLMAVNLIYEGSLWEGWMAFAVPRELSVWLVILEGNQLLHS